MNLFTKNRDNKHIASYEEFEQLRNEYEADAKIRLQGRDELLDFLKTEYDIEDPVAHIRKFEELGRDFDYTPPCKLTARFLAVMDFEHYDEKRIKLLGKNWKEREARRKRLIMHGMTSQFFNHMTAPEFKRLRDRMEKSDASIAKINATAKRCEKSIKHSEQVIKRATAILAMNKMEELKKANAIEKS